MGRANNPGGNKNNGSRYRWLVAHVDYSDDACLIWPFAKDGTNRGRVGYDGKSLHAHRVMCEMVHGPCPPGMECAHSCGNGHLACVNPSHLRWATRSENQRERRKHGTHVSNRWGNLSRFTDEQILEMKAMAGKETNAETAKRFGCHAETVRYWQATTAMPKRHRKPKAAYRSVLHRQGSRS